MRSFPWKWRLADLPEPPPDAPTAFSTFACGGGSSMGYKRAGFRVLGCVEIDPQINAIYRANLHPAHNYRMDLREFNRIPDADLPPELFDLDVLDGSPPCSTFSMAGKREAAWGKEKRFRELRPRVVVAENVTGLVKGNAKGYVNAILARFRELGYVCRVFQLNAAFMEVPQRRERVFFAARRIDGATPPDPPPLALMFDYPLIPFREVRSPSGLPIKSGIDGIGSTARLLEKAWPSDEKLSRISERERGRPVGFTHPLVWPDTVCPTVTSSSGFIRMPDRMAPSAADYISVGTFPQDYDLGETDPHRAATRARYLVGMSVPPSMAAHLADKIRGMWLPRRDA